MTENQTGIVFTAPRAPTLHRKGRVRVFKNYDEVHLKLERAGKATEIFLHDKEAIELAKCILVTTDYMIHSQHIANEEWHIKHFPKDEAKVKPRIEYWKAISDCLRRSVIALGEIKH